MSASSSTNASQYADFYEEFAARVKKLSRQGGVSVKNDAELDKAIVDCVSNFDNCTSNYQQVPVTSLLSELDKSIEEAQANPIRSRRILNHKQSAQKLMKLVSDLESGDLVPGQPPFNRPRIPKKDQATFVLARNDVPKEIYRACEDMSLRGLGLSLVLGEDNYIEIFQKYLWVEEAYLAVTLQKYELNNISLTRYGDYFSLKVPGLEQGRPSLMAGDSLLIRRGSNKVTYQGFIHHVRADEIRVKFHERLHATGGVLDKYRFDAFFSASRTTFKWLHHGLCQFKDKKDSLHEIVYPKTSLGSISNFIETDLGEDEAIGKFKQVGAGLNKVQIEAVVRALEAKNRPAPYIIFGPPGTGKTRTLVELIHQIYKRKESFKILVCGNSNSCADVLTERILEKSDLVDKKDLIRIASYSRLEQPTSSKLIEVIKSPDDLEESNAVTNHKIFVTTCIKAGYLNNFENLQFDYVIIDEAGHSTEPEALIPIGLLKKGGSIVLAGDPYQLGPICLSNIAGANILGTSFLERLSQVDMYKRREEGRYNSHYITKLTHCYRSDPRLLQINNEMFYDGDLVVKTPFKTPPTLFKHMQVSNPLLFNPVKGKESKRSHSASWCNLHEIFACIGLVRRLYKCKFHANSIKPESIGIVTPYSLQIDQLNYWFDHLKLNRCKIGTVESFQGDEREIIIISTVRTLRGEGKDKFRFLFQPKRFNVATSRSRWMTILVGDPGVLGMDPYWEAYISLAETIAKKPNNNGKGKTAKPFITKNRLKAMDELT